MGSYYETPIYSPLHDTEDSQIVEVPMNKVQVGAAPSPNLKTIRSKIGSLDNTSYKPGGGKVKIEHRKLDFSKTQPKIAAKNDAYVSKGGDKKVWEHYHLEGRQEGYGNIIIWRGDKKLGEHYHLEGRQEGMGTLSSGGETRRYGNILTWWADTRRLSCSIE
uniref:Uncharacterized protein n=1 Tax=Timema bartmani TaxID=61472 RepID=A0A7R9F6W6_9NEOP|nr:unnamed protein product [Timema bartmani]